MKKVTENNKITIDGLAIMVAKGFEGVKDDINEIKNDMNEMKSDMNKMKSNIDEVKENLKATRNDILNIGDKFVSYNTFDRLASRVTILEKKTKGK